jgi:hypothetical protein
MTALGPSSGIGFALKGFGWACERTTGTVVRARFPNLQEKRPMRKILLTVALLAASVFGVALTPGKADAFFWRGWRSGYVSGYYSPYWGGYYGSYYRYPAWSYYGPAYSTYYAPSYSYYYTPPVTTYYSAPVYSSYYYSPGMYYYP